MFSNLTLFQMAKKTMDWAARREQVLAQNVANADTPGYRPSDLQKLDFKAELTNTQPTARPVVTNPMHVADVPFAQQPDVKKDRQPYEAAPDGNAVILEEQMQKVGDTRSTYEVATTLFSKNMKMLRLAIGKPG
jgi:flagellar basal-body rod protein FlgB